MRKNWLESKGSLTNFSNVCCLKLVHVKIDILNRFKESVLFLSEAYTGVLWGLSPPPPPRISKIYDFQGLYRYDKPPSLERKQMKPHIPL